MSSRMTRCLPKPKLAWRRTRGLLVHAAIQRSRTRCVATEARKRHGPSRLPRHGRDLGVRSPTNGLLETTFRRLWLIGAVPFSGDCLAAPLGAGRNYITDRDRNSLTTEACNAYTRAFMSVQSLNEGRGTLMRVNQTPIIVCLASTFIVLLPLQATYAVPLPYSGGVLSEDFNFPKLAKAPDGFSEPFPTAGLLGWDSDEDNYIVMDGTTTTGAIYSFGTLSADDRALGSIASGGTGIVFYGLELRNDSPNSFSGFDLTYTGEQWRQTTAGQNVLNFQYSLTASSVSSSLGYTGAGALDFAAIHFGSATGGIDGNAAANRTTLSSLVSFGGGAIWDPGETLFIRWRDADDIGFDQGLGIDDLGFRAVPEPSTLTLAGLAMLGLLSFCSRRRGPSRVCCG